MVHLAVGGTPQIDGELLADGADGPAINGYGGGGGAGGAVWVEADRLEGPGLIAARGGDGGDGASRSGSGGGGGRVAMYVDTAAFGLQQVETQGGISPREGEAWQGGAGTAVLLSTQRPNGELRVDNAGVAGQDTPLVDVGGGRVDAVFADRVTLWDLVLARPSDLPLLEDRTVRFGDDPAGPVLAISPAYEPTTLTLHTNGVDLRDLLVHGQSLRGIYVFDAVTVTGGASLSVQDTLRVEGTLDTDGGSLLAPRLEQ